MFNISCNLLKTILRGKNRKVVRVQSGFKCMVVHPCDCREAGADGRCPASPECILLHMACLGKDHNSKLGVLFLLNVHGFCTIIKSKNIKPNHYKSGTVCISRIL